MAFYKDLRLAAVSRVPFLRTPEFARAQKVLLIAVQEIALGSRNIAADYKSETKEAFPYGHGRHIENESHLR